ncbi:MAG: phosphatidate cytidylyltransferase [Betaproteobacteria bacterium]|nr:phosphatidate cytidylyltransferase [Betaproteobacteria bacterium]
MFSTRLATAVVLLAACVSALLYLPNRWWTALLLAALLVASWEWATLAGLRGAVRWLFAGLVPASAAAVWLLVAGSAAHTGRLTLPEILIHGAAGIFWLLIVVPWLARRRTVRSPLALTAAGWIVLVPAWLALTRLQADAERLLAVLGAIWLADTAAYLAGRTWGRHKLAPHISPGKTWEGLAGAWAAVAVYYVALSSAMPAWGWQGVGGAVLFAGVALMSVVGDLFESWVKRQSGVKDSGSLLPGHGGILDRIDSMTAALPIAALLLPYADRALPFP